MESTKKESDNLIGERLTIIMKRIIKDPDFKRRLNEDRDSALKELGLDSSSIGEIDFKEPVKITGEATVLSTDSCNCQCYWKPAFGRGCLAYDVIGADTDCPKK